jgi:hypothetical protein
MMAMLKWPNMMQVIYPFYSVAGGQRRSRSAKLKVFRVEIRDHVAMLVPAEAPTSLRLDSRRVLRPALGRHVPQPDFSGTRVVADGSRWATLMISRRDRHRVARSNWIEPRNWF